MRFRHLMIMVAVGLGLAACSLNPVGPTAGSLSVPAVSAISIDTPTLVEDQHRSRRTIVLNPAPKPPAPVVAPKPPVTPPPAPAAGADACAQSSRPRQRPHRAPTPPPAAPTAPVDGPCGATPCAPPVTTTCPAGTVPTLGDVVTCEPPAPPDDVPTGNASRPARRRHL